MYFFFSYSSRWSRGLWVMDSNSAVNREGWGRFGVGRERRGCKTNYLPLVVRQVLSRYTRQRARGLARSVDIERMREKKMKEK